MKTNFKAIKTIRPRVPNENETTPIFEDVRIIGHTRNSWP